MFFNKNLCLFFILLAVSAIFGNDEVVPEEDSTGSDKRVINGTEAVKYSRPFIVALQEADRKGQYYQFCGGSVIDKQWVLTAAHCFDDMQDVYIKLKVRVKAGAHTANTPDPNEEIRRIEEVYIHPAYDPQDNKAYYDIALIKLSEPLKFKANIQPIQLPDGKLDLSSVEGEVMGWGAITPDGKVASDVLLFGKVHLGITNECNRFGEHGLTRLCLIGPSSACVGDSGGPFVTTVNGVQVQVGIVSIGGASCYSGKPFIVTNVQHYLGFIKEKMGNQ